MQLRLLKWMIEEKQEKKVLVQNQEKQQVKVPIKAQLKNNS